MSSAYAILQIASLESELGSLKASAESQRSALLEQHALAMDSLQLSHKETLEAIQREARQASDKAEAAHGAALAAAEVRAVASLCCLLY